MVLTPAFETRIAGLPDNPKEVVAKLAVDAAPTRLNAVPAKVEVLAVPVTSPTKELAVTTPALTIFLLSSIIVDPEILIAIFVIN